MNQWHGQSRIGVFSAMSGAVLLSVGTYLHPSQADPNDAPRHLLSMQLIICGWPVI